MNEALDLYDYIKVPPESSSVKQWRTGMGKVMPIAKMSEGHIKKVLNFLACGYYKSHYYGRSTKSWTKLFHIELAVRMSE